MYSMRRSRRHESWFSSQTWEYGLDTTGTVLWYGVYGGGKEQRFGNKSALNKYAREHLGGAAVPDHFNWKRDSIPDGFELVHVDDDNGERRERYCTQEETEEEEEDEAESTSRPLLRVVCVADGGGSESASTAGGGSSSAAVRTVLLLAGIMLTALCCCASLWCRVLCCISPFNCTYRQYCIVCTALSVRSYAPVSKHHAHTRGDRYTGLSSVQTVLHPVLSVLSVVLMP